MEEKIKGIKYFILNNRKGSINIPFDFYTSENYSDKENEYSILAENKNYAIELMKGVLGELYDDTVEIRILKSLRSNSLFESRPFHLVFH